MTPGKGTWDVQHRKNGPTTTSNNVAIAIAKSESAHSYRVMIETFFKYVICFLISSILRSISFLCSFFIVDGVRAVSY